MTVKRIILLLGAMSLFGLSVLRVGKATSPPEILLGCFLAALFGSYILAVIIEGLPVFKSQSHWLNNNRRILDYGFVIAAVIVFEILFLNFEPASEGLRIAKAVSIGIFAIGGLLIIYRVFRA